MTNKEWLDYLAQNAPDELAAWFDAERVTNQAEMLHIDASDGDTAALNATIAELERKLRISWEYECKFQDERDVLQAQVDELTAERDNWKADLLKANNEREALNRRTLQLELHIELLRSKLSRACDNAHDTLRIMDEGMA